MSWTAMWRTGRKRPLSFSSMKKLFPSEICSSNSRYYILGDSNMAFIRSWRSHNYIVFLFSVSVFLWRSVDLHWRKNWGFPHKSIPCLSSIKCLLILVAVGGEFCATVDCCILKRKVIQLWENLPCQHCSGLILADLMKHVLVFAFGKSTSSKGWYHGTVCQKLLLHHAEPKHFQDFPKGELVL